MEWVLFLSDGYDLTCVWCVCGVVFECKCARLPTNHHHYLCTVVSNHFPISWRTLSLALCKRSPKSSFCLPLISVRLDFLQLLASVVGGGRALATLKNSLLVVVGPRRRRSTTITILLTLVGAGARSQAARLASRATVGPLCPHHLMDVAHQAYDSLLRGGAGGGALTQPSPS
jgi:hypothetical protein